MIEPSSNRTRDIPVWVSLLMVLFCLGAGGWFVRWYLKSSGPQTVVLAATPNANQGGNRPRRMNGGFGWGTRTQQPPTGPARDGVVRNGRVWKITAGHYTVSVDPRSGSAVGMTFGTSLSRMPDEPPDFIIVRQIAHDKNLTARLAVKPNQLEKIKALAAQRTVSGSYRSFGELPLADADLAQLQSLWSAYQSAAPANQNAPEQDLVAAVKKVGDKSLADLRAAFIADEQTITRTLSAEQLQAYRDNRSLAAAPASPPATIPAVVRPATPPIAVHAAPPASRPAMAPPATTRPITAIHPASTRPAATP